MINKVYECYKQGFIAGVAKTVFDKEKLMAKLYTHSNYLTRIKGLKVPSAFLYVKKEVFFDIGGFDESLVLAEDVNFSKKVKKKYGRKKIKVISDSGIITSARRFEQAGYIKTLGQWLKALVSPGNFQYDDSVR